MRTIANTKVISFHLKSILSYFLSFLFLIQANQRTEFLTDSQRVDGIQNYRQIYYYDIIEKASRIHTLNISKRKKDLLLNFVYDQFCKKYRIIQFIKKYKLIINQFKLPMEDKESNSFLIDQMTLIHTDKHQAQSYVVAKYERGRNLGAASYSNLYQVRQLYSAISKQHQGRELVLKQMKATMPQAQYTQNLFKKEIDALLHLKDLQFQKYFIKLEDYWKDQNYFYLVFQKCKYGSLSQLLNFCKEYKKPLKKDHIIYIAYSILRALQALHESNIIHQDIKPQNIMFDDNLCLKLIDFGLSTKQPEGSQLKGQNRTGTIRYMAPQLLQQLPLFYQTVDIWSLGVLLYYIVFSVFPLKIDKEVQGKKLDQICQIMQKKIKSQQISFNLYQYMEAKDHQQIIELIKLMLQKSKKQRKKAKELLTLPIFEKIKNVQQQQRIRQDLMRLYSEHFKSRLCIRYKWKKVEPLSNRKQIPKQLISRLTNRKKVQINEVLHIDKFGFFLLLSNNCLFAYFNDHSQFKYSKELNEKIQEEDETQKDKINKMKILLYVQEKYFKQKMQKLQSEISTNQQKNQQYSRLQFCSIQKIFYHKSSLFVRLSNKTLQVFFQSKKPLEHQKEQRFITKFLTFNNDSSQPEKIYFIKNNKSTEYANYKEAQKFPQCSQYIDFVRNVFTIILDNSSISLQKYGYQYIRGEN